MSINQTLSLDEETVRMLQELAESIHISKSAYIRVLIVENYKEQVVGHE